MVRNATNLAERIKALDKEAKMDVICRLMADYCISQGDLIEYLNAKGSTVKSDSERLREINQARKNARRLREDQQKTLEKARAAKAEKRKELLSVSKPTPTIIVSEDVS